MASKPNPFAKMADKKPAGKKAPPFGKKSAGKKDAYPPMFGKKK
jgi:hypothetical protein